LGWPEAAGLVREQDAALLLVVARSVDLDIEPGETLIWPD